MVGVPGRSKGCHLCRKRKIACSLERPECLMCRNSGRKCPGYQRDRIFIHQTTAKPQSVIEGLKQDRQVSRAKYREQSQNSTEESSSSENTSQISNAPCVARSHSLVAAASQQQIFDLVLSGYRTNSQYDPHRSGHWIAQIPEMTSLSPALEVSCRAFCIAKLGRMAGDDALRNESLKIYTRGLHELQKALWDPKRMYEDQTLGACILSAMYEVFECPGESTRGYQNHHDGCARLIQARGPSAHASGLGHSIFVSFRFIGALQALVHKTTFLSDPMWKTIPFSTQPKGHIGDLIDLLLEAPGILARSDEFRDLTSPSLQLWTALELLRDCRDLENKLRGFHDDLAATFGSRMYCEIPRTVMDDKFPNPSLAKAIPVKFSFVDLRAAGLLTLYWAMMTMLLSGIQALHYVIIGMRDVVVAQQGVNLASLRGTKGDFIDPFDLQPLGQADDFRSMACNVFKSVVYCLESSELGLSMIVAPLQMVRDVLKDWPGNDTELQWALAALEHVKNRGVGIVQYMAPEPRC